MRKALGAVSIIGVCMPLLLGTAPQEAAAQGGNVITYPRDGQSREQHDRDRLECSRWAVENTGFDPKTEAMRLAQAQSQLHSAVASAPPDPNQGGMVRGAAGGAALGAIGGAIGGNAGRGAAIGAGTGALFGSMRHQSARNERAQWDQQQASLRRQQSQHLQNEFDQGMADYERAFSICMRGRNYEVM